MKTLVVEWHRLLDEQKQTCPRCGTTEHEVDKAVKELNQMLNQPGVVVSLVKKAIDPERFKKDVLQSNKILIAGKRLKNGLRRKPARANAVKHAATLNVELLSTPTRPMKRSHLS
jgi:hypothetical protein